MAQYIVRRITLAIPTLLLVVIATFMIVRMQPGDALLSMVGEASSLSDADRARIRQDLGIDQPVTTQFVKWVGGAVQGDLGRSFFTRQPVNELLARRFVLSAELAVAAIVVALTIAIPLGVASAYWRGSFVDYLARGFAVMGLSMPDFWIGLIVIVLLVSQFGWLPPLSYEPLFSNPWVNLQQVFFPMLIVGYRYSAITMRMMRSATLEILSQDYVRTARAKGLTEPQTMIRHVARNALIPVVTIVGLQFAHLFNVLVVIEVLFGLPGIGSLTYDAALTRDYPIVQGSMLLLATITVLTNLAVDLSYGFLDPRIRA